MIDELKKDMAAAKEESATQKLEITALRDDVNTLQTANAILQSKLTEQQHEDAFIEKVVESKISESAVTNKDANAGESDDDDFDDDAEDTRSVDFRQCQYDTLKEHIERIEDELHVAIADNKKYVMTKLATKFQKRLDIVASGLAEHVAQIAELKESGAVVNAQDLKEQISDLYKAINNGTEPNFNTSSDWKGADPAEQGNQEKNRSANMDKLGMAGEFQVLKEEVYEKFKVFAGGVDKELKRVNIKLGSLPVTSAERKELEAYNDRIEAKMENIQYWLATINQKLVELGHANLVGPHS